MRIDHRIAAAWIVLGALITPAATSAYAPAGWTKVPRALAESCTWEGENSERRSFFGWRVSAPADDNAGSPRARNALPVVTCVASGADIARTGRCVERRRFSNGLDMETPHGLLEGYNAGEFGGGLVWKGVGGEHAILLREPIRDMHATQDGVLVFGGLNHLSGRRGAVWRVDIGPDRRASIKLVLRLFTAPGAIAVGRNGSAIVSTSLGVIRVTPKGTGEELFRWSPGAAPMARPGERHPVNDDKSWLPKPLRPEDDYSWNYRNRYPVYGGHRFSSVVEMTSGTIWGTTASSESEREVDGRRIDRMTAPLLVRLDVGSRRRAATFFIPPNCRVARSSSGAESCECELD
jgi:hypothetical protein